MKAKVLKAVRIKDGPEIKVLNPGTVIEVKREDDIARYIKEGYLELVVNKTTKQILNEFVERARECFEYSTLEPCIACKEKKYWLSIHGAVVCGICHPPASKDLVKRWL